MRNIAERVLIVVPTHNRLNYLKLSVASVLAQSYSNLRLVVSDNSTNDDAKVYISDEVHDSRVEYIRFGDGAPAGEHGDFIERLIANSPENIVTIMHDDDQMTDEHIADAVKIFHDSIDIALVASPPSFINKDGRLLHSQRRVVRQYTYKGLYGGLILMRRNKLVFSSIVYRKPAYFRSIEFRRECLGFADFASNLVNVLEFGCLLKSNATLLYRIHDEQDINNYDQDPDLTLRLLDVARRSAISSYGKRMVFLSIVALFFNLLDRCQFFARAVMRLKAANE